jgi:hypothetical protein
MQHLQNSPPLIQKALAYVWAAPASMIGLLLASAVMFGPGQARRHSGVLEVCGGHLAWLLTRHLPFSGPVAAITFGHVVLACSKTALDQTRRHERVHVAQYERWGPLFLLAYPLASLWAWSQGKHPYLANAFEIEARAAETSASPYRRIPHP